jgi:glyceraldehyde 3-phosphate dehydrogenase
LKIAINGFGRIGRSIARVIANRDDLELVAINDLEDAKSLYYLLKYDSIHGVCNKISFKNDKLFINNKPIKVYNEIDNQNINFGEVDVVFECTGKNLTTDKVKHHLLKGAKKVIISAPAEDHTPTYVLGVNSEFYKGEDIISNASCTTNCLGPIAKILDTHFGIKKGLMTTIHSYTNDQKILDVKHTRDIRRGRAASVNMIPTTTGAAKAMYKVLPSLKGKLHGQSVRVPVADVSIVDFNVELSKNTSKEELQELFINYSQEKFKGILGLDSEKLVSNDILENSFSSNVALDLIQVVEGNMVKVMSWYDNEWGYSNRMCDMAKLVFSR